MKVFICLNACILRRSNRSFDVEPQTNSSNKLTPVKVPHSNAFLDLSGDFTAGTEGLLISLL